MSGRRLHGDAGQVGGIEAVPFGLVVLLVGILLVAHTWSVVDAKFLTTAAAREATRAYVEAADAGQGLLEARRAADDAVRSSRRRLDEPVQRHGGGTFARCTPARFEARLTVPGLGLPWRDHRPEVTVRSAHQELVDPFRDGLAGTADCGAP